MTDIGVEAFSTCTSLTSCVFRPPRVGAAYIVFAISNSRNRDNWGLTSVKQLRNVLRLITMLALERRDVASVDPDGEKRVFEGCTGLADMLGLKNESDSGW